MPFPRAVPSNDCFPGLNHPMRSIAGEWIGYHIGGNAIPAG
jgi:hypothetical protein